MPSPQLNVASPRHTIRTCRHVESLSVCSVANRYSIFASKPFRGAVEQPACLSRGPIPRVAVVEGVV